MNWKPIETAPTDDTWIIVIAVEPNIAAENIPAIARFSDGKWRTVDDPQGQYVSWPLTHWMPLPSSPTNKPYHTNQ